MTIRTHPHSATRQSRLRPHRPAMQAPSDQQAWAADLHEDVGGALAVLAAPRADPALAAVARQALASMRGLLRSAHTDCATQWADLCSELANLCEVAGVQLDWPMCAQLPRLRAAQMRCVQRVLREALNNAIRHGRCSRFQVWAAQNGAQVEVIAQHDGCGFSTSGTQSAGHGLGLANMAQRAQRVGATLQITSQPALGTSVQLVWANF